MIEIINKYYLFWKLLASHFQSIKDLKILCHEILMLKKKVKLLFSGLNKIIKINKKLFNLSFYYKKYVLFEPFDVKKYRLAFTTLNAQFNLEMFNDRNLYFLDPNSFVLKASCHTENLGQILWVSKNGINVLEMDEKRLLSLTIDSIMPSEITKIHKHRVQDYLKYTKSTVINKINDFWIINSHSKLTTVRISAKVFFQVSGTSLFSYVKRVSENQPVFINMFGEVKEFGSYFSKMTALNFELVQICKHIPLFVFMPQLIVHFLNIFYEVPHFLLKDINKINLEFTHFIVFKNIGSKLIDFSKDLQSKHFTIENYVKCLYQFLHNFRFKDVQQVFRIKFNLNNRVVNAQKKSLSFWIMNILELEDVSDRFTERNFRANYWFIRKLNLDELTKHSIQTYPQRVSLDEANYEHLIQVEKTMVGTRILPIFVKGFSQYFDSRNSIGSKLGVEGDKNKSVKSGENDGKMKKMNSKKLVANESKFNVPSLVFFDEKPKIEFKNDELMTSKDIVPLNNNPHKHNSINPSNFAKNEELLPNNKQSNFLINPNETVQVGSFGPSKMVLKKRQLVMITKPTVIKNQVIKSSHEYATDKTKQLKPLEFDVNELLNKPENQRAISLIKEALFDQGSISDHLQPDNGLQNNWINLVLAFQAKNAIKDQNQIDIHVGNLIRRNACQFSISRPSREKHRQQKTGNISQ